MRKFRGVSAGTAVLVIAVTLIISGCGKQDNAGNGSVIDDGKKISVILFTQPG